MGAALRLIPARLWQHSAVPVLFLLPLGALCSFVAAYRTRGRARHVYAALGGIAAALWLLYVVMLVLLELPD